MRWYYSENDRPVGPIDDLAFKDLVAQGRIRPGMLVWHEGLPTWLELTQVQSGQYYADAGDQGAVCAECGRVFPGREMIRYDSAHFCADCKSLFLQKIKEGLKPAGSEHYGGFWVRAGAKIIDWIVLWGVQMALTVPVTMTASFNLDSPTLYPILITASIYMIQFLSTMAYNTIMVGRWGATVGKMVTGLKVVTADGGRVGYLRALGRYFAEIVSALILMIGYIMAAFDEEKRTLHDRICHTRVVVKGGRSWR
jgi:uncharacterized RDD family membrane protein YckC